MPELTVSPDNNTIAAKPPVPKGTPVTEYVRNKPMNDTGMSIVMASD